MRRRTFSVCCAAVCAAVSLLTISTRADDANVGGVGGTVELLQPHKSIRMLAEDVRITNPDRPVVLARFVFKNDGPATDVLMGFPELGWGDAGMKYQGLGNFQSWIDGRPIHVVTRPGREDKMGDFKDWLVKRVHFDAHQTRTVVDSYQGGGGYDSNWNQIFTYVLSTASSWNGPVGHARVICDLGTVTRYSPIRISPAGFRRYGQTLVWDYYNLEPVGANDITLTWFPAFQDVRINDDKPGALARTYWFSPPVRRSDDVWLPAKLAAEWLGATFVDLQPGRRVRIKKGGLSIDVTVGSATVKLSNGKTLTMLWPSNYARDRNDSRHAYCMVSLRTLVTALGGRMTYYRDANRMEVVLPEWRVANAGSSSDPPWRSQRDNPLAAEATGDVRT